MARAFKIRCHSLHLHNKSLLYLHFKIYIFIPCFVYSPTAQAGKPITL